MRSQRGIPDFLSSKPILFAPAALVLGLTVSCMPKQDSVDRPAPNISNFTTITSLGNRTVTNGRYASGSTVTFLANFSQKGGTAIMTPGNIAVQSNVPFAVPNVTASATYTLTVKSEDGQVATKTCVVTVPPAPSSLHYGAETVTYYKDVQIAPNTATVSGGGTYTYSVSPTLPLGLSISATTGAISGTPQATTAQATYTVTAKDDVNQSTTCAVKVTIADTPLSFALTPNTIAPGGTSILSWNANSVAGVFNQVTITASPADTSLPSTFALAGTANVHPTATTTYTITAVPVTGGTAVQKSASLTVGNAPLALTAFTAAPSLVYYGAPTTLSWAYTGIPLSLTLDGADVLALDSKLVTPAKRQTYTLSGSNALNTAASTLTKTVAARGIEYVAGKPGGIGSRDGVGTLASFNQPQSIAADANGNLYVAEISGNTFRKITPAGVVTTIAGNYLSGSADATGNPLSATFNGPRGIFPDSQGYIWLCDSSNGKLRVLTPQNDVKTVSGYGGTTANSPNQIVITSNNGTTAVGYIADYKVAGIVKVTIDLATMAATPTTIAGFTLSGPSGICADANGIVYALDTAAGSVKAIKNDVVTALTGHGIPFISPYGVAALTNGTTTLVLVAEPGKSPTFDNRVYRFAVDNSGATPSAVAGSGIILAGSATAGAADGKGDVATFAGPQGITVFGTTAYVVDSKNIAGTFTNFMPASGTANIYNNTVRALSNVKDAASAADVTVTTFAGYSRINSRGNVPATSTATAAEARFSTPQGLAVAADGSILLADASNNKVRKITAGGTVSNYPNDAATFTTPIALALDAAGNLYVLERGATAGSLQKIALDGTKTAIPATGLSTSAAGLVVDATATYLYVTDNTKVKQVKIADGTVVSSTATFTKLVGITQDDTGLLYVVDGSYIKSLASITAATATTLAGSSSGFLDHTTGTSAKLNQPNGIVFVKDGTQGYLLVSDFYDSAIRLVTLGGTNPVTTMLGRPNATGGSAGLMGTTPGRIIGNEDTTNPEGGVYRPQAIALTPTGDLVVSSNDCVLQITAPFNK